MIVSLRFRLASVRVILVRILMYATIGLVTAQPSAFAFEPKVGGVVRNKTGAVLTTATLPDQRVLVGGKFGELNGEVRQNLGRLRADGGLDPGFSGSADDVVCAMVAQADGGLLVGGMFRQLSGEAQPYVGRVLPDGSHDSKFKGGADYHVFSLWPHERGGVFVGGAFRELAGQPCSFLGRLDAQGGLDGSFVVELDAPVHALVVQPDGAVIAGGRFHVANGQPRHGLARWFADGQLDAGFSPAFDGQVNCVVLQPDGCILVGGHFTRLNGRPANRVVRLLPDGRPDPAFVGSVSGGANPYVQTLALRADGLMVLGGQFEILSGQPRNNLGALFADGTLDQSFVAEASAHLRETSVSSVAIESDGSILVGGSFTNLGGIARRGLGRIAVDTPAMNQLRLVGRHVVWHLGGSAPAVTGVAFEWTRDGDSWTPLMPSVDRAGIWSAPMAFVPAGATLRARGYSRGGTRGGSAAMLSAALGPPVVVTQPADCSLEFHASMQLKGWAEGSPDLEFQWFRNGEPLLDSEGVKGARSHTLELSAIPPSAGGQYHMCASNELGSVTSRVAILAVRDPVIASQATNSIVNLGGTALLQIAAVGSPPLTYVWFKDGEELPGVTEPTLTITNAGLADHGQYRALVRNGNGASTISANLELLVNNTGVDSFDAQPDRQVMAIAPAVDGGLFVGGNFTAIGGGQRNHLARLDATGQLDSSFVLEADDAVLLLQREPAGGILVGGNFTQMGGASRNRLARIQPDGNLDDGFNPDMNDAVLCAAQQPDGRWLVGGLFTSVRGRPAARIVRLHPDGSPDTAFLAGASFAVRALALQGDGRILVGGQFRELSGQACDWLGRVNADGTLDTTFRPKLDGAVAALVVQADGDIVVGGEFTSVNGVARRSLARLRKDGRLDVGFQTDADGPVMTLRQAPAGGLLVGGAFATLGGQPRQSLGWVRTDGTVLPHFCPDADNWVRALEILADGKLVIAGNFAMVAGLPRRGVARLN